MSVADENHPVRVLAFAGSLRRRSLNRALVAAAVELAPADMTIDVFALGAVPMFDQDLEEQGDPVAVGEFKARLRAADALLIAVPEYNWSVPGVLKNAIDWASRRTGPEQTSPLAGKTAALMGAGGGGGTRRAQEHLRLVLEKLSVQLVAEPQVYLARASALFDAQLRLIDESARADLLSLLLALRSLVRNG